MTQTRFGIHAYTTSKTQSRYTNTGVVGFDYPPVFFTGGKDSLENGYPQVKIP